MTRPADTGPWRLLADVGGTNVRFGRSSAGHDISDIQTWPNTAFASFEEALQAYLETLPAGEHFASILVAAAGPATRDAIELTNIDWVITPDDCRRVLGRGVSVQLMNDLESVAYALPHMDSSQVDWIDAVRPSRPDMQRMLAVNVGTGFGSAAIIRPPGRSATCQWVSCPAESGHMSLGICDEAERALLSALGIDHPTLEDVLSGDGVRRLWSVLADDNAGGVHSGADHQFDFAATDAVAKLVRAHFSKFLARAAANLALASTAWDGVYFCGSVVNAWWAHADHAEFRRAFVGTGLMRQRLAETPIGRIRHELPAFVGLAHVELTA